MIWMSFNVLDSSIRESPSVGMQVRIESPAQPLLPLQAAGLGSEAWASDLAAHGTERHLQS
jgi:hypothetical protein